VVEGRTAPCGLTDRQLLFQVELPLASGVHLWRDCEIAAVLSIDWQRLAAAIGAGGLGGIYFFADLAMGNKPSDFWREPFRRRWRGALCRLCARKTGAAIGDAAVQKREPPRARRFTKVLLAEVFPS